MQQLFVTGISDGVQAGLAASSPRPGVASSNANEKRDTVPFVHFKSRSRGEQRMRSREWQGLYRKVISDKGRDQTDAAR